MHAKRSGNTSWADKIDFRTTYWGTPGAYVEKSTLLALGRNVSGFELPEPLYENNTFDAEEPKNNEYDVVLAINLRKALTDVLKKQDDEDESDEEEDDEEGDDGDISFEDD